MAFVGRDRALSRLLRAVEEAAGGRARLVLVAGEAGLAITKGFQGVVSDQIGNVFGEAAKENSQAVSDLVNKMGPLGSLETLHDLPNIVQRIPD